MEFAENGGSPQVVALRKVSGGTPNTAGGTPALPAQRLEFGLGCGSTMMLRLRRWAFHLAFAMFSNPMNNE
jgi:hypothetical protein